MNKYSNIHFSPEQRVTVEKMLDTFAPKSIEEHGGVMIRMLLLLAHIQSGKTACYMLLACYMLYLGKVKECIIMSGMTDLDLKTQTEKNKKEAIDKFRQILIYEEKRSEEETQEILYRLDASIHIYWGSNIKNYKKEIKDKNEIRDVAFFVDEAHYAQNKGMKIDKFFEEKIGIHLNGKNMDEMERRNFYVVTISATPFSEICDIFHRSQNKSITRLIPSEGYRGLKEFWNSEQIKKYDPENIFKLVEDMIINMIDNHKNEYTIVRVNDKSDSKRAESLMSLVERRGGKSIAYNSETKKYDSTEVKSFRDLLKEPSQPTFIFVKGMGRCGHNVPKIFIHTVIETSKDALFCTILQSLLGRMFGYDSNPHIQVYLPENIVNSGDIEKAISFYDGVWENIPNNTRNVIPKREVTRKKTTSTTNGDEYGNPILPIKLLDFPEWSKRDKSLLLSNIREFIQERKIETENSTETMDDLYDQLQQADVKLSIANITLSNKSYAKVPSLINKIKENSIPKALGSSNGSLYGSFKLYVFDYDIDGFRKGDMYLDGRTRIPFVADIQHRIPRTTGHELFSRN